MDSLFFEDFLEGYRKTGQDADRDGIFFGENVRPSITGPGVQSKDHYGLIGGVDDPVFADAPTLVEGQSLLEILSSGGGRGYFQDQIRGADIVIKQFVKGIRPLDDLLALSGLAFRLDTRIGPVPFAPSFIDPADPGNPLTFNGTSEPVGYWVYLPMVVKWRGKIEDGSGKQRHTLNP
jgi:hypothetical protein